MFKVPKEYKASNEYDWTLVSNGYTAKSLKTEYPSDYFTDFVKWQNKSKTYISKKTIEAPPYPQLLSVKYAFDENGLRKTVPFFKNENSSHLVMSFGDSFTLGEGVKEGFDYPSQLQVKLGHEFLVKNYGFHGMGLNDFFYRAIQYPELFNLYPRKSSTLIWLFIPMHLERFFCHLQCMIHQFEFIGPKPLIDEVNGSVMVKGRIDEDNSLTRNFLRLISRSKKVQYLNFEYPNEYSNKELKLFADALSDFFNKKVQPGSEKKMIFVNISPFSQKETLFNFLKKNGVEIFDYSDIPYPALIEHSVIPIDSHPTSEFYWVLTELLKKDVFHK